jgi:hypothetical protein
MQNVFVWLFVKPRTELGGYLRGIFAAYVLGCALVGMIYLIALTI